MAPVVDTMLKRSLVPPVRPVAEAVRRQLMPVVGPNASALKVATPLALFALVPPVIVGPVQLERATVTDVGATPVTTLSLPSITATVTEGDIVVLTTVCVGWVTKASLVAVPGVTLNGVLSALVRPVDVALIL